MSRNKWIVAITCGVLACMAVAGSLAKGQVGKGRFEVKPVNPADPAEQLTRVQMDVFELACTHEQLAKFELDAVSAGQPPAAEVLGRLGQLGAARLLIRYDNVVNLTDKTTLSTGEELPSVDGTTISDSTITSSIAHRSQSMFVTLTGGWLVPENPLQAVVSTSFNLRNPDCKYEQVTKDIRSPVFEQRLTSEQSRVLKSGEPVWLACNDLELRAGEDVKTHVTIVRFKATRLAETN
jgi:hypothetical protein